MSNNISVSMHCGSGTNAIKNMADIKRCDLHNNRKYKNNKNEEIDLSLSQYNVTLVGTKNITEDIKEFYKREFAEATYNYNKNQKDERRKIVDYLDKMNKDSKSNIAVEFLFQVGDKEDWENKSLEDKQKTVEIFKKAIPILEAKGIKTVNASLHLDETSPHLHLIAVPIIEKQKRGLEKQVSQNKVITKTTLKDIRTEVEKAFIEEYNKVFNTNKELKKGCEIEEHLQVKDYKNTKKVLEVAKKTADKQVLKEKIEKDYKKLDDEVKEKEKENNFLTNQLTKLEREKTEKKQDLEKIKKDIENIDNIREELNNQYQDIEKLKANKDSNNSIIEMYKNNAVETREKIDNLKKEFNRLEDERLEKEKENQEQKERIRNTQEAILKDLENAEKIKEERKKRLEELEKENKELNNKIEEQENTLRKLQSKSEELEEKIKKLKTDEDTIMSKISNNSDKNEVDEVDIASLIDKLDNYELVKEYDLYNTLPPFQIFTDELIYDSETGEGNSELAKNLIISAKGEEFWDNMNLKDIREWEELFNLEIINIAVAVDNDFSGYNGYDDYSKETIKEFLEVNTSLAKELEKAYNKHSKEKVKDELEEETTKEVEKDFFKF
jgi:hypothetical protein